MFEKIRKFFSEIVAELKKVTWPTTEELKESTRVVVVATIVLTMFIGVIDQILSRIVKLIFG